MNGRQGVRKRTQGKYVNTGKKRENEGKIKEQKISKQIVLKQDERKR
jgi:hypothetical protein